MAFTEVTRMGWGGRMGNSIKGALFGVVLFCAAFPLLFWNEGRAVQTAKSLKEGKSQVISADAAQVDPANEGKLIHLSGLATSEETLADPDFGVSALNALKLVRQVEMYQWKELKESRTREKVGGGTETETTYNYEKTWSADVIDSTGFRLPGHTNPTQMPYRGQDWLAQNATVGAYQLPSRLIGKMKGAESLPVQEAQLSPAITPAPRVVPGGTLYVGADPNAPTVGDVRVTFTQLRPTEVSIIAQQQGGSFTPFPTKAGKPLEFLQMGTHDAQTMFATQERNNKLLTWVLRIVGFVMMAFGLSTLFQPLIMFARFIPFLGSLLNVGVGLFAGAIAFVCSLVTIAIAWIFYRPLLGIGLLIVAGAILAAIFILPARIKLQEAAPKPEPA